MSEEDETDVHKKIEDLKTSQNSPKVIHSHEVLPSPKLITETSIRRKTLSSISSFDVDSAKNSRSVNYGNQADTDQFHLVSAQLTFALAYPKPTGENLRVLEELIKRGKKTLDAPRPSHYFRCEYILIPGSPPCVTDIVAYPVAAKIFHENETKVVKAWDDGKFLWITWSNNLEFFITEDVVHAIHGKDLKVRICSGKDKVSQKARNDKPKAFRLDSQTSIRGVKEDVENLSNLWMNFQPKTTVSPNDVKKDEKVKDEPIKVFDDSQSEDKELTRDSNMNPSSGYNRFSKQDKKKVRHLNDQSNKIKKHLKKSLESKLKESQTSKKKSTAVEVPHDVDVIIPVRLECLFAGEKQISTRLEESTNPLCDVYINLSLDKKLLPKALEKKLNPLVLTIKSVKDLPNTPISYESLKQGCQPVFCKYSFMGQPCVVTKSRSHGKDIFFDDVKVFFLGDFNPIELREYFQSESFYVEVHDRNQLVKEEESVPTLYGLAVEDQHLENTSPEDLKKENNDSIASIFAKLPDLNLFAYHGVSNVSLIDILKGQTNLYLETAVLPSKSPEFSGKLIREINKEKRLISNDDVKKTKDKTKNQFEDLPEKLSLSETDVKISTIKQRLACLPLPPGDYMSSGTSLKIHIKLAYPFIPLTHIAHQLPLAEQVGPISRLVLYFSYSNKCLLRKVDELILMVNAKALDMTHFEDHVMQAVITTLKLTKEQKESLDLDVITGFHVIDEEFHIFVLEGLRSSGIKFLIEEVSNFIETGNKDDVVMIYDSSISFSKRIYIDLDIDLTRIRLYQPLSVIITQTVIYIRDIIPQSCLDCIFYLNQITKTRRMRDMIRCKLFPSVEMLFMLNRELGIAVTFKDFEDHHEHEDLDDSISVNNDDSNSLNKSKPKPKIQFIQSNLDYKNILESRKKIPAPNYITKNKKHIAKKSKENFKRNLGNKTSYICANTESFNYSTQSRNSTIISKSLLLQSLKKIDPKGRFYYNDKYNWAIVSPAQFEEDQIKDLSHQKQKNKFVCSIKLKDQKKVDEARIEDLKLAFRDNILHENKLKSTLPWRDVNNRDKEELQSLYTKPQKYFSQSPITIQLAGNAKKKQLKDAKLKENDVWLKKLVVNDPKMYFHRLSAATEQSNRSNQCDQMTSLLKDPPKKFSLSKIAAPIIPPLNVVQNPTVDSVARKRGDPLPSLNDDNSDNKVGFQPGGDDLRTLRYPGNFIPIKDERNKTISSSLHSKRMNLIYTPKSLISKGSSPKELTREERNTHYFKIPPNDTKFSQEDSEQQAQFQLRQRQEEAKMFGVKGSEYREKYSFQTNCQAKREQIKPVDRFHGFVECSIKANQSQNLGHA